MIQMLEVILLISVLAISAFTDIKKRIIPNRLVFPAIGLALFFQIVHLRMDHIIIAMIGCSLLFLLYTINENLIGGGDIKLIFFLALMVGAEIGGIVYITAIYTSLLIVYYYIKQKLTKQKQVVPLALALFLAVVTSYMGW